MGHTSPSYSHPPWLDRAGTAHGQSPGTVTGDSHKEQSPRLVTRDGHQDRSPRPDTRDGHQRQSQGTVTRAGHHGRSPYVATHVTPSTQAEPLSISQPLCSTFHPGLLPPDSPPAHHRACGKASGFHISSSPPSASPSNTFCHPHQAPAQGKAVGRHVAMVDKEARCDRAAPQQARGDTERAQQAKLASAQNCNLMIFLGKNVRRKSIPTTIPLINNVFSCSKGN